MHTSDIAPDSDSAPQYQHFLFMTDEEHVLFSKARAHDMPSLLVLTAMPLQANTTQLGGLLKGQIVQDAAVSVSRLWQQELHRQQLQIKVYLPPAPEGTCYGHASNVSVFIPPLSRI